MTKFNILHFCSYVRGERKLEVTAGETSCLMEISPDWTFFTTVIFYLSTSNTTSVVAWRHLQDAREPYRVIITQRDLWTSCIIRG